MAKPRRPTAAELISRLNTYADEQDETDPAVEEVRARTHHWLDEDFLQAIASGNKKIVDLQDELREATEALDYFKSGDAAHDLMVAVRKLREADEINGQLRAALQELVTLKDERPADYEQRKPLAWQAARDILAAITAAPSTIVDWKRD